MERFHIARSNTKLYSFSLPFLHAGPPIETAEAGFLKYFGTLWGCTVVPQGLSHRAASNERTLLLFQLCTLCSYYIVGRQESRHDYKAYNLPWKECSQ